MLGSVFSQPRISIQVNIIAATEDANRSWFGLCESRMRVLIAGLDDHKAGVRAFPFVKFFHRKEGGLYVSSFFIALRFAKNVTRVDLVSLS